VTPLLSDEVIDKYRRAGWIAKTALDYATRVAKPGMKLLDLAVLIENKIVELGGSPAFPVNLGVNDIAAHYTPVVNDDMTIPENSVLKIDIGVHIDGYIADTATTISFNPVYDGLVEASRKALEKALEVIKPGIRASVIGKIIEETIKSHGYRVIKNLSGHSIDRYLIHSGKTIPNYNEVFNRSVLTDGVYAVEPFATNGVGLVESGDVVTIYSLKTTKAKNLLDYEEKLYNAVWSTRRTLPFCERWYTGLYSDIEVLKKALQGLDNKKMLVKYPILVERKHGYVSQFEHTFIINGNEVIVTTM